MTVDEYDEVARDGSDANTDDGAPVRIRRKPITPYERAELGFRDYWYPVCTSGEVTEKPKAVKVLGDAIAILRRGGKVYALADACPHRGTQLSLGKCMVPGTPTISCAYHGWTFDVRNGACVAVLCEGPESGIVGRAKVRTYPMEERKGILWIWMGRGAPAPLEDDVPKLLLREDTVVRVCHGIRYGNWRFHAENLGGGHAQVLHRDALGVYFRQLPAYPVDLKAKVAGDVDGDQWVLQDVSEMKYSGNYPGLGTWPPALPRWRQKISKAWAATSQSPLFGVKHYGSALRLPGLARSLHYPFAGCMYYEWWVASDKDHYNYFQVSCGWPKTTAERLKWELKYRVYGEPLMVKAFNGQDVEMVRQTTDFVKRRGGSILYLSRLTKQDLFHTEWRRLANAWARGEGNEWLERNSAKPTVEVNTAE